MDNNQQDVTNNPQVVNPQTVVQPSQVSPAPSNNSKKKMLWILAAVLILVVLLGGGYFYYISFNQQKTYNATLYNEPSTQYTPTPTQYQSDPKDTSDTGIDKDSQVANQNINFLDSDLKNVDQSLNDQQTNLQ